MIEWLIEVAARWSAVIISIWALLVSVSAHRWKKNSRASSDQVAHEKRIAAIENDCHGINRQMQGVATRAELAALREHVDERLKNAPSKADFAELSGRMLTEAAAARRDLARVEGAIGRVETFLLERKL